MASVRLRARTRNGRRTSDARYDLGAINSGRRAAVMGLDWERVKEVFGEALELAGAAQQTYLDDACRGDPELRAEVDRLLTEHNTTLNALETSSIWERPPAFEAGQILNSRFEIVRLIGRGGFGEVYEVVDQLLDKKLALKTLQREVLNDPDAKSRFKREIAVAQQISHPNVCRVFDVLVTERDGFEVISFTMELLEGETLAALLARQGPFDEEEGWPLVEQIVQGLAALHERGVVHRDLKPRNILVTQEADTSRRVVLTDFGCARPVQIGKQSRMWVTKPGQTLGTPAYMAPEQFRGEELTAAADIYALGVVLHEMISGSLPRSRTSASREAGARSPGNGGADPIKVAGHWGGAISRCLDRDPNLRPHSARAVAAELAGGAVAVDAAPPAAERRARSGWFSVGAAVALGALALYLASSGSVGKAPPQEQLTITMGRFRSVSGRPDQAALAAGLSQSIAARIERLRDSNEGLDVRLLREPARELRPAPNEAASQYLVTGTISENNARLVLQVDLTLLGADSTRQSRRFEAPGEAVLALEDDAERAIIELLNLRPNRANPTTGNPDAPESAHRAYLIADGYLRLTGEDRDLTRSIELFRKAISLYPSNARAYRGLCEAFLQRHGQAAGGQGLELARSNCDRSLQIAPEDAATIAVAAEVALASADVDRAEALSRKALTIDPRNARAAAGLEAAVKSRQGAEANR